MLFRSVILDINLPYEGNQSGTGTQEKYLGPGTHVVRADGIGEKSAFDFAPGSTYTDSSLKGPCGSRAFVNRSKLRKS